MDFSSVTDSVGKIASGFLSEKDDSLYRAKAKEILEPISDGSDEAVKSEELLVEELKTNDKELATEHNKALALLTIISSTLTDSKAEAAKSSKTGICNTALVALTLLATILFGVLK
jgi:hypothetical protein